MARACSRNRHGGVLARPPGRHARRHSGPRPLRLVLGLLVVVAFVFAATVMPAVVALADTDDGGAADSGTEGTEGDTGDTSGTEGVDDGVDDVGLANDEDPGLGAEPGVSADPGGSADPGVSGPVGYTGPGAVPATPTQHEVTPPGPASIPTALPGPPSRATMPGADMMPGIAGWYAGPGGNTKEHGQHESDE
jgi:hypothetical protein